MTTVLITRTAFWDICRHRCFERNNRQVKNAGGTTLQGQLHSPLTLAGLTNALGATGSMPGKVNDSAKYAATHFLMVSSLGPNCFDTSAKLAPLRWVLIALDLKSLLYLLHYASSLKLTGSQLHLWYGLESNFETRWCPFFYIDSTCFRWTDT